MSVVEQGSKGSDGYEVRRYGGTEGEREGGQRRGTQTWPVAEVNESTITCMNASGLAIKKVVQTQI